MGEDVNPPNEKVVQKATEAGTCTDEAIESIIYINQVFQLYSNLLMEEARSLCCKILGEQIDCSPWIDSFGVKHAKKRKRSGYSFMDCMTFHLLLVFWSDAAETQ
jgi:ABC-type multidrug transport system ATPase subunit